MKFPLEESCGHLSQHEEQVEAFFYIYHACIESKQLPPFWRQELFVVFLCLFLVSSINCLCRSHVVASFLGLVWYISIYLQSDCFFISFALQHKFAMAS